MLSSVLKILKMQYATAAATTVWKLKKSYQKLNLFAIYHTDTKQFGAVDSGDTVPYSNPASLTFKTLNTVCNSLRVDRKISPIGNKNTFFTESTRLIFPKNSCSLWWWQG